MKKKFVWQDLEICFEQMPIGRTKHALGLLLMGETVDFSQYPRNPKRSPGHRGIGSFCCSMKRLLKDHKGVEVTGNVARIPELQKPKSFLKEV